MINQLRNRLAGHPNGALLCIAVVLGVIAGICILALLLIMAGQWFFGYSPWWLGFGVTALAVTAGIYWPLRKWLHAPDDDDDTIHYISTEEVQS